MGLLVYVCASSLNLKRLTNMCITREKKRIKQSDRDFFSLRSQITGCPDDRKEEESTILPPTGYEN